MTCQHCGLPARGEFCCSACELVYSAIQDAGLGSYYQRRDALPLQPPRSRRVEGMNAPQVQARYVRAAGQDCVQADLWLDGLHCAACCWLVEKAVERRPGVLEARVNYSTARLAVTWDPAMLGLGDVMDTVRGVGYTATPRGPAGGRPANHRTLVMRLGVAAFCAGNIMLLAISMYAGDATGIDPAMRSFFRWVSMALATVVVLYPAQLFFTGARAAWRERIMTMDVPISLGILTTYTWSLFSNTVYYDTVAMFVFVLLIGRMLEMSAQRRAAGAVEGLLALSPRTATRVHDGTRMEVPVDALVLGDHVEVLPGGRVPVDGMVMEGRSWVNESMWTGEPAAVSRGTGDRVSSGTLAEDGRLLIRAERTGSETALARIAAMVERAQSRRSRLQRLTDRAAAWFVGIVLVLAAGTFAVTHSVMIAVSVLIITCPCALGLATPLAVALASGYGATRGILVRDGDTLEALTGITHVLFDKTGTLTEGALQVVEVLSADVPEACRLAAAVEIQSSHPLARAICHTWDGPLPVPECCETIPGFGMRARVEGHDVCLGSTDDPRRPHATLVGLTVDGQHAATFVLQDTLRAEAADVVAALHARGLKVGLLSGDREGAVRAVASAVGIGVWQAGMTPARKAAYIDALQREGARVAMVGDGINDAVALSAAHVGIAVGGGADVAVDAAHVVLLRPGLRPLEQALDLAKGSMHTIRTNIRISVLYNLLAIPAAMTGHVMPLLAAVAMPVSSLLVVANSLRTGRR
ncbi:MAG: heavy metal translocating P-type ATPase [Candidatus Xenobia bacterium]